MTPTQALVFGLLAGAAPGLILAWWLSARNRARHDTATATLRREHDEALKRLQAERETERKALRDQIRDEVEAGLAEERQRQDRDREREDARLREAETKLERLETKVREREAVLDGREAKLTDREAAADRRADAADRRDGDLRAREQAHGRREQDLAQRIEALDQRQAEVEARAAGIDDELQRVAGLSADEAKAEVLKRFEADLADEQARRLARHEKDVASRAKELGVEIIGRAIQRYAAEHTAETSISRVPLKEEEFKGRIIGKDGRNIKAFEQAAGVDLLIDETPGFITVSCFSGLRREIARRALEVLLEDGRIHPGRIEEVLVRVQADIDREVHHLGEDAAFACDVSGLHPQLIKLLGKLHWRTSYGQNVLKHTQEVAFLCGAMAADLGLDPRLGRRCGLLHDIGKAIDHEQEGSHPVLGYEALKRYNESEIVANAALAHHEGHEVLSTYTVLAAAADAISAARPGARRENTEKYLKRLAQIEAIACDIKGVQKAYAIQAGRELRVIVNGHDIADSQLTKVAHDIARRIEGEVTYPGEVKVTLIRETRSTAVAR